jgi:hypothetical protein
MSTSVQPASQGNLTATAALDEIQTLVGTAHPIAGAVSTERLMTIMRRVPGHWVEYQANDASDRFNIWRYGSAEERTVEALEAKIASLQQQLAEASAALRESDLLP